MIHLHRSGGEQHPSIQISPMIDMVILLLIFFIVCTMYGDSCSRKPMWK